MNITKEMIEAVAWSASSHPGTPFGMILADEEIECILSIGIANAPAPSSHLVGALRAAEEEFNRISCEGVTENRSVSDALDRAKAFADRGAIACRRALAATATEGSTNG